MDILLYLIPIALTIGVVWLLGFLWALRHHQFEDLDGNATRILYDGEGTPPDDA